MQKISIIFLMILGLGLSLGCEKKEYDSSKGAKKQDELIKPTSVPNELETLSYRFIKREQCEGYCNSFTKIERCDTIQSFKSKKEFCEGLRDAKLNNQCAKEERQDLYLRYCGDSFVEENVAGISNQLEDPRVGSCSYTIPESNGAEFCNSLKDEFQHSYCGWEERRVQFIKYNCEGDFSTLTEAHRVFKAPAKKVTEQFINYSESVNQVYEVFTRTYTFDRSTTNRSITFDKIRLVEDNCEVMGQASFQGNMSAIYFAKNPDTGAETPSAPSSTDLNIFASNPSLGPDRTFEFTINVLNPGKCQNIQFSYEMEVR